jgi:hypothetical protein
MFRLVRGTGHILDALDVLHRDRLDLAAVKLPGPRVPTDAADQQPSARV